MQAAEMGFLRRVHSACDIPRRIAEPWNSQNPECRATSSPNRDMPAMLVLPCVQNAPLKTGHWRVKFSLAALTGMRPRGRPKTRRNDYNSDLACSRLGVESAELPEIAVDLEVFRVVLGLLPLRSSPWVKRARKWMFIAIALKHPCCSLR